jgi:hypothetical protein
MSLKKFKKARNPFKKKQNSKFLKEVTNRREKTEKKKVIHDIDYYYTNEEEIS